MPPKKNTISEDIQDLQLPPSQSTRSKTAILSTPIYKSSLDRRRAYEQSLNRSKMTNTPPNTSPQNNLEKRPPVLRTPPPSPLRRNANTNLQDEAAYVNSVLDQQQQQDKRPPVVDLSNLTNSQIPQTTHNPTGARPKNKDNPNDAPSTSELLKEIAMLKAKVNELKIRSQSDDTSSKSDKNKTSTSRSGHRREPQNPISSKELSSSDSESNRNSSVPPRRTRNNYPSNFRCEMDRWPIRFNGSNVQTFLKKLNRLQISYGYSDEIVAKYFHLLLEGNAASWFWTYCDDYDVIELNHLKYELSRVFRSEESDIALTTKMSSRLQGNDSFEKFYYDILEMNYSRKIRLNDSEIIEILRDNMDDEVRQRVFTYETNDKVKFFKKANKAYKDVLKTRLKRNVHRRVHEIDFENLSNGEIEEISNKLNNYRSKRNNLTCFNCHSADHLLRDCPDAITRFFCFKCGLDGYATPKCPKCSLNPMRSVESNRDPRS